MFLLEVGRTICILHYHHRLIFSDRVLLCGARHLKRGMIQKQIICFFPERVVTTPYTKVQADLRKHKLSLQLNKHTDIWVALCKAFHDDWNNDPRELIKNRHSCVTRIINHLQENKKKYPYLNGNKMSNYWLYILDQYTDITLQNKHKLSIIPDTHVAQCSIHLGMTTEKSTPEQITETWFTTLQNSGLTPVEMHPVLWNWSRNNFLPEV
jgi:hypothetical protein